MDPRIRPALPSSPTEVRGGVVLGYGFAMALKRSHLSSRTRAYTKTGVLTAEVVVGTDPDLDNGGLPPSEHEYGWKPIWLKLQIMNKQPIWIIMSSMTVEELEAFKRLADLAFEDALVVARDLDRQATDLLLRGDDELPLRALASAPPWYEREVELAYDGPPPDDAFKQGPPE